jgi:hypothetical protein
LKNKDLIFRIREAFKGVLLDGGIGLSEAEAIDDYKDEAFKKAGREKDEKQDWEKIPSAELNEYHCSLSFFDAKGMRFHLPAFLIADLKQEYRFGMAFALTHLSDYTKAQFSLLTHPQRQAVRCFLEYLLVDPDHEYERPAIRAALENYWTHDT